MDYLPIFVGVTAAAVVIQAGILVALFVAVKKSTSRMEALATEVKTKVMPTVDTAQSMLVEKGAWFVAGAGAKQCNESLLRQFLRMSGLRNAAAKETIELLLVAREEFREGLRRTLGKRQHQLLVARGGCSRGITGTALAGFVGVSFMTVRGSASEFRTSAGNASCMVSRLDPSLSVMSRGGQKFPDQADFLNLVPGWTGHQFLGARASLKANCDRRRQK